MADEERYDCPGCGQVVGSERVLVLTAQGQQGWHPYCHAQQQTSP